MLWVLKRTVSTVYMFKLMGKKIITILCLKICLTGPMLYIQTDSSDMTIFSHKNVIIFLSISLSMCFGCSKEPSH